MPENQGVTDRVLDRLLNRAEAEPEPRLDRMKTITKHATINDRILESLKPGTILSCNGICHKTKCGKDTVSAQLPKMVKKGLIRRARISGIYFYWRLN